MKLKIVDIVIGLFLLGLVGLGGAAIYYYKTGRDVTGMCRFITREDCRQCCEKNTDNAEDLQDCLNKCPGYKEPFTDSLPNS